MEVKQNLQNIKTDNVYRYNYNKNIEIFKKYEWCNIKEFPAFEELNKIIIENTNEEYTVLDRVNNSTSIIKKDNIKMSEQLYTESFLLHNINDFANIVSLSKSIQYFIAAYFFGERKALYVYYDDLEKFLLMLQTAVDINALTEGSLIFFVGKETLLAYDYLGINSSEQIIGNNLDKVAKEELLQVITNNDQKRWQEYEQIISDNNRWYQENNDVIQERIRNRKPRIMFLSTTTRNLYFDKLLAKYFADVGLDVKVQIEETPFYKLFTMCRISQMQMLRDINEFKPDIIFTMLGERTQLIIPPEIYWLAFICDDLGRFKNQEWIKQLTPRDYFLDGFCRKELLQSRGYCEGRIIIFDQTAPIPETIYRKHNLSILEQEKYGADIVFVANTMTYEESILRTRKLISDWLEEKWWKRAEKIVTTVYDDTRAGIILKHQQIQNCAEDFCVEIQIEESKKDSFTLEWKYFLELVAYNAFRHKIADWLVDSGYTNLKLYGKGWSEIEKFALYTYANTHDETPKIYQAAKININPSIWTPIAGRTIECFMCGGFMLNYIPDEEDINNHPSVLDNESIFYDNKEDLLQKIDFYLANPREREIITEKCRKKILDSSKDNRLIEKILAQMAETIDAY